MEQQLSPTSEGNDTATEASEVPGMTARANQAGSPDSTPASADAANHQAGSPDAANHDQAGPPDSTPRPGNTAAPYAGCAATSGSPPAAMVCVKFIDNDSKQWDGKIIAVEADWIQDLYPEEKLEKGKVVSLPWKHRGTTKYWKAVIVADEDLQKNKPHQEKRKRSKHSLTLLKVFFIHSFIIENDKGPQKSNSKGKGGDFNTV